MKLRFSAALLLLPLLATPSLAGEPAEGIFKALDKLERKRDIQTLSKRLRDIADAEELLAIIQSGRPEGPNLTEREGALPLTDKLGRETRLYYILPEGPAPKQGYGILMTLHGLNAPPRMLFNFYRKLCNREKLILLSPHARRLPFAGSSGKTGRKVEANEDSFGIEPLPQWFAYRSYGFPMRALSAMKKLVKVDLNRVLLTGYSMGGYGTWNLGLRYPDRFAALAPMAGSISRREKFGMVDARSRQLFQNARAIPTFLVHGAKDTMVPPNSARAAHKTLKNLGADVTYHEMPESGHRLSHWFRDAAKVQQLKTWLTKQRRNAHPKTVEHLSLASYMNRSYWLEITKASQSPARVKATIQSPDTVVIECQNVEQLRLYIDPTLLSTKGPITVICNGQRLIKHPKASIETVLRSYYDREDPELTYSHAIDLKLDAASQPAPQAKPQSAPKARLY